MNHPTKCMLCFAIVLLILAAAFAATASTPSANASSDGESTNLSSPQVFAIAQPPVPVSFTLTMNVNPPGTGSVTQNPPVPSAGKYISPTVVYLTAVESTAGWKFDNWTVDANLIPVTANPTNVTMTANHSVTANFSQKLCWKLTISLPSGGSITPDKQPNCIGGEKYITDTLVQLTAKANDGYVFSRWTTVCDSSSGSGTTCDVKMTTAKTVAADFSPCYALSTAVSPPGVGSVSRDLQPNCGTGYYLPNQRVVLTAKPNSSYSYTLSGWSGCDPGTSCAVTMSATKYVTASFTIVQPPPVQQTETPTPVPTSSPLATITPLLGGLVATVTVAPTPSSSLPSTGGSPLILIVTGLVLVMIVIGARYMRQSSA